MLALSGRIVLAALPLTLAACQGTRQAGPESAQLAPMTPPTSAPSQLAAAPLRAEGDLLAMYGPVNGEPFPVPAIDTSKIDRRYLRQVVSYNGRERPGTLVVDPANKFLYHVQDGGTAMRYGVGVGKEGLAWSGRATVGRKAEWPRWIPTKDMIKRNPEKYAKWADGVDGGPSNPIGPRALYLWEGKQDTYFRIHGTNEPWTIGTAVSSGCIRMLNQDVIDLYARVPEGTTVVVLGNGIPVAEFVRQSR